MKNSIRCCIACILPCGSLDVIRIVHSNGHVEEISGSVRAAEIMKLYPKHVLKNPCTTSGHATAVCPPDAVLKRGKIYFLIPAPPEKTKPPRSRRKKREPDSATAAAGIANFVISDRYLTEILSEKVAPHRDRRRGRTAVWRPHLESISETPSEARVKSSKKK